MKETPAVSRLRALADPTRLRILDLLAEEELTVRELTDILGMAQSRVSGHLGVLRDAELVADRRQGTSAHYSLRAAGEPAATWKAVRDTTPASAEGRRDRVRLAEILERRRERGREFFDRVAETWDEGRSESLGAYAGSFALAGLLPRRLTVLDLGTGTGALLPLLGRHVDRVIAVDGSRGMLARARKRMRSSFPGVSLVRAEGTRLPVAGASVDGLVANMVLHHVLEPPALFRETARVLKPGGRAVVVDFESHEESWLVEEEGHRWAGFDPAQLGAWCVDAGLTVPEFQRIPTPGSGRWSRIQVFVARFGRADSRGRSQRARPS